MSNTTTHSLHLLSLTNKIKFQFLSPSVSFSSHESAFSILFVYFSLLHTPFTSQLEQLSIYNSWQYTYFLISVTLFLPFTQLKYTPFYLHFPKFILISWSHIWKNACLISKANDKSTFSKVNYALSRYTYTCIYTYIHTHLCIHICIHIHVCIYYTYMYTYIHLYICIHTL